MERLRKRPKLCNEAVDDVEVPEIIAEIEEVERESSSDVIIKPNPRLSKLLKTLEFDNPGPQMKGSYKSGSSSSKEVEIEDIEEFMRLNEMLLEEYQDLERIDHNVTPALNNTKYDKKQLQQSVVMVNKNRKLKIVVAAMITMIVLIILIIVTILLGIFVPPENIN